MSKRKLTVYKVSKNLDEIALLLDENYEKPVSPDISNTLNHRWEYKTKIPKTFKISKTEYSSLEATAILAKSRVAAEFLHSILKDEATYNSWYSTEECPVQFIQDTDSTLVFVEGSKYSVERVRTCLLKTGNKPSESKWGIIEKNLPQFAIEPDLFLWLIDQSGSKFKNTIYGDFKLLDICLYRGKNDLGDQKHVGEGTKIDKNSMTHTFIFDGYEFNGIGITVQFGSNQLEFELQRDGSLEYEPTSCFEISDSTPQLDPDKIIANVYFHILPTIKSAYGKFILDHGQEALMKIRDKHREIIHEKSKPRPI